MSRYDSGTSCRIRQFVLGTFCKNLQIVPKTSSNRDRAEDLQVPPGMEGPEAQVPRRHRPEAGRQDVHHRQFRQGRVRPLHLHQLRGLARAQGHLRRRQHRRGAGQEARRQLRRGFDRRRLHSPVPRRDPRMRARVQRPEAAHHLREDRRHRFRLAPRREDPPGQERRRAPDAHRIPGDAGHAPCGLRGVPLGQGDAEGRRGRDPCLRAREEGDRERPVREGLDAVQGVHDCRRDAGSRRGLRLLQRLPPRRQGPERSRPRMHPRHQPLQRRGRTAEDRGLLRQHPGPAGGTEQEVHVLAHQERQAPQIVRDLHGEPPVDKGRRIRGVLLRSRPACAAAQEICQARFVQGVPVRHRHAAGHVRGQGQKGNLQRRQLVQHGRGRGERRGIRDGESGP